MIKMDVRRYAEWFVLVSGVLFGVVGGLWSLVFVDRGDDALKHLTDQKSGLGHQIESINAASANYFLANQQGDLIYLVASQGNVRTDLGRDMVKGNLLDRATPVRNMIGVLALGDLVKFHETYDPYEKLNDTARQDLTLANYTAVKKREREIIDGGFNLVPKLLEAQAGTQRLIEEEEAKRRRNQVLGVAASTFGSFLLLVANLVEKRKIAAPPEPEVFA